MNFLILLAVPALIVWGALFFRSGYIDKIKPLLTMPNLIVATLISGCCLGHELFNLSVGPIPLTIDRGFWLLMLALFAWLVYQNKISFSALNQLDWCVLGLLAIITISTFSHDWRFRDNLPISRLLFFNIMPVGFYLVARNLRFSAKDLRGMVWILSVFGLYLAATAIAEVKEWHFLVWPRYISNPDEFEFLGRARGPMMNPVANGMVLLLSLASTLILWPRQPGNRSIRVYVIAAASLMTIGILATMTRSVWLGIPIVFFVFVWLPASSHWRGAMTVGVTIAVAFLIAMLGSRINSFQRDKHVTAAEMSESASLRPMLAYVAWEMFEDRPLFGCGFGHYTRVKRIYHLQSGSGMPLQKVMPYMQHNILLAYLTELGILGVGLFVALVLMLIMAIGRLSLAAMGATGSAKDTDDYFIRTRVAGLMFVLLFCWLINGMFHDVSIIPMVGSFMYFLMGVTNSVCKDAFPAAQSRSIWLPVRWRKTTTTAIG